MIIFPKKNEVEEEIICLDGSTSEIMCHLMDKSSTKFNKRFQGKFSATSHDKGNVDGIGCNVKSIVQSQSTGKRKDRIIVQNAKSFYQVAMNATEV